MRHVRAETAWTGRLALVAALVATACAGPARAAEPSAATIHMSEYAFGPKELDLPAGRAVDLTLTNDGVVDHDLVILELGTQVARVRGGRSQTATLPPLAAGTYHVICSIPTHSELGMVGTFVVH